ncbi:MAG TPA: GAF and ANTAR domain-containing protein [Kribbella sp.]|jgi:transcriptional regulator with GAF, ATPase, and Fis domain
MPETLPAFAFADFAIRLENLSSTAQVVEALQDAAPLLLGCGHVSLLLYRDRQLQVAGGTDESLTAATGAQLELGEGPALLVAQGAAEVACPDLRTEHQWPRWAPYAAGLGWRSWLCLRLARRERRCLGVLTVGSRGIEQFQGELAGRAHVLAAHLAVAIDTTQMQENMMRAQDAQMRVGQAVGVLMERYQLDADQAFSVLRRYSQDRQMKLRDVAAELLTTRRLPDVE